MDHWRTYKNKWNTNRSKVFAGREGKWKAEQKKTRGNKKRRGTGIRMTRNIKENISRKKGKQNKRKKTKNTIKDKIKEKIKIKQSENNINKKESATLGRKRRKKS